MIEIVNIPFYSGSLHDAVTEIAEECTERSGSGAKCVSATGAHGLVETRADAAFAKVLKSFSVNLPDGMPVVWLGRIKGARGMERCYGPDFFRDVMVATARMPVKHFFCGGKNGIAEELKRAAELKFGNKNCVGTFSPPFHEMLESDWGELVQTINVAGPHIVWIGLSTPKQELFARELSLRVDVRFIVTVGAAFDIHTGHLRQAPRVLQRLGLEWLFRLAMEPRRLWRRYLKIVPLFLLYSGMDLLGRGGGRKAQSR